MTQVARTRPARPSSAKVRVLAARVVWAVFVLCASALAVAALLTALDAEADNPFVGFVLDLADGVDLGVFDRRDGVMTFDTDSANALVNWGLAAVVWLVVGRVAERLIRP